MYGLFRVRKASQQVTQFGVQTKSTIKIQNEIIIPKKIKTARITNWLSDKMRDFHSFKA